MNIAAILVESCTRALLAASYLASAITNAIATLENPMSLLFLVICTQMEVCKATLT
jgi:hypothetical protein